MLSADREDMLTELVNIGIGRAAYTLSEMVDSNVGLRVPHVFVDGRDVPPSLKRAQSESASVVLQGFSGGVAGTARLAIPVDSARRLVAVLTNTPCESEEIDVEREAVITEVGNIVINSVLGSLGNMASLDLTFGLPRYQESGVGSRDASKADAPVVTIGVLFQIRNHSIEGELSVVFDLPSLAGVWAALLDVDSASDPGS